MPPRTPSRRAKVSAALNRLGQVEQLKLLSLLLKAHPELQDEAEALAVKIITTVDPEAIAAEVVWAFKGFDQQEIRDRSAKDKVGGFVDPRRSAGAKICEERFEPLMGALERLISLGQMEAALVQVKGLLNGCPTSSPFPHQRQLHLPIGGRCVAAGLTNFLGPRNLAPASVEFFVIQRPRSPQRQLQFPIVRATA